MLKAAATSERLADRSNAIAALSVLRSDPRALALVASALQDKDETIRALAANTLADMNARREIPALRKAMDDPSPVVSFAAAKALWKLGDRSGRELFYEVLNGERKTGPGFIQSHINQAKKDLHDPKTLALIGINQASGAFLGPASIGISVVEEYAKDKSSPVQALCAGLLASDDSPDTVEQLSLALDDNNWTVRAAAARALAKIHDTNAVHKLEIMIQTDREPAVRLVAAAAVLQLTTRRGSAP
jgi:HEAT repeat protein